MTDVERRDEPAMPHDDLGPEQGGGPPAALPWTLVVEGDEWSADLEHGAPLPCVNDQIEYIAADGTRQLYRVTRIVHTLQPSASGRPPVAREQTSPNATVNELDADRSVRELRAGLPRVFVTPLT